MRMVPLLLMLLAPLLVLADDFKLTDGTEYKNAKVSRVEPDGIMVTTGNGVIKLFFTELPKEVQEKYQYNPKQAEAFRFRLDAARDLAAEQIAAAKERRRQEFIANAQSNVDRSAVAKVGKNLDALKVYAVVEPFQFEKDRTFAHIQIFEQYDTGVMHHESTTSLNLVPVYEWRPMGDKFVGVIDERMPDDYQRGDQAPLILYNIGHTDDSSRHPLFTLSKEKAVGLLIQSSQEQ
jgi:hypothetical protein